MNDFTEVTAESLEYIRGSKGMRQQEIADLLDIPQSAVSKIEKGNRSLSSSEKSLLDWFFFGKLPPRMTQSLDLRGTLQFTSDEWRIVELMARRSGQTPDQWIRNSIKTIIDFNRPQTSLKVAEDPAPYNVIDPATEENNESGEASSGQ